MRNFEEYLRNSIQTYGNRRAKPKKKENNRNCFPNLKILYFINTKTLTIEYEDRATFQFTVALHTVQIKPLQSQILALNEAIRQEKNALKLLFNKSGMRFFKNIDIKERFPDYISSRSNPCIIVAKLAPRGHAILLHSKSKQ
uniref:Uncharacterized protein n=1 Tax=Rhizophagus irregularis (strain DAOM 181602 / DAOM 197198 / MUCL 43194) TaxID=747089 RepID=U9T3Y7_RHIID